MASLPLHAYHNNNPMSSGCMEPFLPSALLCSTPLRFPPFPGVRGIARETDVTREPL